MDYNYAFMLIETIFTIVAAAIYVKPLVKKEPAEKHCALGFGIGIIIVLLLGAFMKGSYEVELVKQILLLFVLWGVIYYVADLKKGAALYVAIWTLLTSQFVAAVWYFILLLFPFFAEKWKSGTILLVLLYAYCMWMIDLTIAGKMPDKGKYFIGPRQLSSAIGFTIGFEFLQYRMALILDSGVDSFYYGSMLLAEAYCLIMLYVQTELFKKSALEKELLAMNLILEQQRQQYKISKDNIDLINRKCHDLKHQVQAIRHMDDEESKEQYLAELEQSVQIYEAIVKTGNEVLDTILTEKSLYCEKHGIRINCIVDGSKLDFIHPGDLYVILGNAIDNAVESVRKFEDRHYRIIDLSIYENGPFLVMEIRNPMQGDVTFANGLPVTTKEKNGYHGFGLQSIKHTVEKYDGIFDIDAENGSFTVKLLFPMKEATKDFSKDSSKNEKATSVASKTT